MSDGAHRAEESEPFWRGWPIQALWSLILIFVIGVLIFRSLGENERIKQSVARNTAGLSTAVADLERVVDRQQREIRADCAFKKDIADLPRDVHPRGQGLVQLATDARSAYITKGCVAQLGKAPPIYKADPVPAPTPGEG